LALVKWLLWGTDCAERIDEVEFAIDVTLGIDDVIARFPGDVWS